ncbi:hypothetical protein HA402_010754 [Bradysia odoriphaga]|nr:hypothetical protein HA402_010754 [Bradysia odoriphaga]
MKPSQAITIFFLHLLLQVDSQNQIVKCGRLGLNNLTPFLTKSSSATHHWPWHAAIYHLENEQNYQCGGSLISSKSVLTAGHCVTVGNVQLDVEKVFVSLGRLNLDINENSVQSFGASEIFVHPDYNSIDYANDIAIIVLSADAIFNNYVQPICLWKPDRTDISEILGKFGTVVGWGLTENGVKSNVLQQANFPVVKSLLCLKSNPAFYGDILSETNFCAGTRNGTGACQGDSGGSISFEENGSYYIRGIVSVGQGKVNLITQKIDCDAMQYVVFTDVAKYLSWIKTTLGDKPELSSKSMSQNVPQLDLTPQGCLANGTVCQADGGLGYCCSGFCYQWAGYSRGFCQTPP